MSLLISYVYKVNVNEQPMLKQHITATYKSIL